MTPQEVSLIMASTSPTPAFVMTGTSMDNNSPILVGDEADLENEGLMKEQRQHRIRQCSKAFPARDADTISNLLNIHVVFFCCLDKPMIY
jgi:hypothetical protein